MCDKDLPLSTFVYRKDSGKHRTECNTCRAKTEAARRYNITVADVEEMDRVQGSRCAICSVHADEIEHAAFTHNPLVIDHDHKTGKVRGLLCPTCNAGLGHFKDDPATLAAAIAYLTS